MDVHLEDISEGSITAILRAGPEARRYGDPFQAAYVVVVHDDKRIEIQAVDEKLAHNFKHLDGYLELIPKGSLTKILHVGEFSLIVIVAPDQSVELKALNTEMGNFKLSHWKAAERCLRGAGYNPRGSGFDRRKGDGSGLRRFEAAE